MQKSNNPLHFSKGTLGSVKPVEAQNGGTKGHSKPSVGGTQAGPPPPPQPSKK
jgi:hypothetical protein